MHIKKLSFLISKVLVAGCVSFAFTGTASAYSNGYWQGLSPAKFGQYKFRPVDSQKQRFNQRTGFDRPQRPQTRNVFSRFDMPAFVNMMSAYSAPMRFAMPHPMTGYRSNPGSITTPAQILAENNRYYQMGRYSRPLKPAFARQYGWTPATKMVVRKGGGSDHYASEVNAGFAHQTVAESIPEYRTEPVTHQGFRYRTINRNPGHVSFADKLRHLVPQNPSNTFRQEGRVAINSENWQKPVTEEVPAVVSAKPIQRQFNNSLVQVNASGYRFRPDARFESQDSPAFTESMPVNTAHSEDFQLANAKMESVNLDSSNQWFFRPSQPTPF